MRSIVAKDSKPGSTRFFGVCIRHTGSLMRLVAGAMLLFPAARCLVAATPAPKADFHGLTSLLKTDDLANPLGIDDPAPRFSWQMRDSRTGARQTAYEIEVAESETTLQTGKADVWDSGRIASAQSVGVQYGGPALKPMTRYWWRVLVWDKDGKAFLPSSASWWETGLMNPVEAAQQHGAQWIGWQTAEENALREANARWVTTPETSVTIPAGATTENLDYRLQFKLSQPVKRAVLFVTGEDVSSAWINGKSVARGASMPPWHQFPWRKYLRIDVTQALHDGNNLLAIETSHFLDHKSTAEAPTPMSATLLVTGADGTTTSFATGDRSDSQNDPWMVAVAQDHPAQDSSWTMVSNAQPAAAWKPVVDFATTAAARSMEEPLSKPWPAESVKALRKTFAIHKPIASARLYVTTLGAYQIWVNGHRAGNAVLAPGWSDYRLRLVYQTYDVTHSLTQGRNAVAAELAPGWYSTPLQWFQQPNVYGLTPPSLVAMLHVAYSDGSDDWVVTDGQWQATQSPILKAEIYDGETQDARMEMPGWQTATFAATDWKPVEIRQPALQNTRVFAQDFEPIRIERLLRAQSVSEPRPGVFIYDFGQNFAGVERLALRGPSGTTVRVRTGEIVNADGTLYTDNLRTAKSTDTFILSGKGTEQFQPQFTFHGFRYIEVTGLSEKLPLDAVHGVVLHTDAPFAAQLTTGSTMLNQLWSNILWGQRSNFVGVPTDCPQRDERLGWTADAQVFWRAASYNMKLAAFSRKYARDLRGTQVESAPGTDVAGDLYGIFAPGVTTTSSQSGAGWSDAGIIIPWTSWLQTGDTTILQQNWAAMTRYVDAIERTNPDHLWKNNAGIHFGDWLSPTGPTKFTLVATAYWAYDVTLMQQMAHALGKTTEEQHYAALFQQIQKAYQTAFVQPDGFVAGASKHGSGMAVNNPNLLANSKDTQTGYVLTLAMNMVSPAMRARVADHLVARIHANHDLLGTGFLGTPYLLAVLTDTGHADLAYRLLLNTQYPSWGYLVDHGATTMWERWNGEQMKSDPSMNSYNHYAYGAVADWIYRYAAGVDTTPGDPGFHTVLLHPTFSARVGQVDLRYPSPYGEIHSQWNVTEGKVYWSITLPANSAGTLKLTAAEATHYRFNGKTLDAAAQSSQGITANTLPDGQRIYTLSAGDYAFVVDSVQ